MYEEYSSGAIGSHFDLSVYTVLTKILISTSACRQFGVLLVGFTSCEECLHIHKRLVYRLHGLAGANEGLEFKKRLNFSVSDTL